MKFHELYILNDGWDCNTPLIITDEEDYDNLSVKNIKILSASDADDVFGENEVYSFNGNIVIIKYLF